MEFEIDTDISHQPVCYEWILTPKALRPGRFAEIANQLIKADFFKYVGYSLDVGSGNEAWNAEDILDLAERTSILDCEDIYERGFKSFIDSTYKISARMRFEFDIFSENWASDGTNAYSAKINGTGFLIWDNTSFAINFSRYNLAANRALSIANILLSKANLHDRFYIIPGGDIGTVVLAAPEHIAVLYS